MPSPETNPCRDLIRPQWAIDDAHGQLVLGAHLPTKDGRHTGNAHIVAITAGCLGSGRLVYTILTDAGSSMHLLEEEVHAYYHPPEWVSDVAQVVRRFGRSEEEIFS